MPRRLASTRIGRRIRGLGVIERRARTIPNTQVAIHTNDPPPTANTSVISTRFVVLSEPRSGSTLLVQEINRRWREIRSLGEVFQGNGSTRTRTFADIKRETYFQSDGPSIVGCKVFRGQLTQAEWSELLQMENLRVIILRRRNPLRRYLSEAIALRTARWAQYERQNSGAPLPVEDRRVSIDTNELLLRLSRSLIVSRDYVRLTSENPRIDVWYEDLAADLDGELRRIASFLGAGEPSLDTPPKLIKQNPEPMEDLIINVEEVEQFLHSVGLAGLLAEQEQEQEHQSDTFARRHRSALPTPTDQRLSCWPTDSQLLLLQALLGPEDSFETLWRDWLADTPFWARSERIDSLRALAHHRLRRVESPATRLHDFRRESTENTARKILLHNALQEAVDELSTATIDAVLLGSTALLAMSTDRTAVGFRTLTLDGLDLTTRPEQFGDATRTLNDLGWITMTGTTGPAGTVRMRRADLELRLHPTMLHAATGTSSSGNPPENSLENSLRSGLIPAQWIGTQTMIPAPTDLLLCIIVDGLLARPAGTISWIPDAHRLLCDVAENLDWHRFIELTTVHRLAAPIQAAVNLFVEIDPRIIPEEILEQINLLPVTDRQQAGFDEMMRWP